MSEVEREDEVSLDELANSTKVIPLRDAARAVIDSWEHGDLARAVRDLNAALDDSSVIMLSKQQALQIAEIMRRYVGEELQPRLVHVEDNVDLALNDPEDAARIEQDLLSDIGYIQELEKLLHAAN